ncbi:SUF system NifU family Fe-S cluster assembly protein [Paenibacillus athensensis]|uniref:SUF system NifU family Fe-S cluster assembly protein n=1 Tax=Paenibacillus athensensis TaxID=1967502 RepID=A0A4Y8QA90_9BACL|nr:SUF system NifU family Fe-S cluster assembly protein [Paenibacillus athensensis]MCD1257682.1 SUF system NifU family Fe-S cluster assembly protein [Paenibacillus athensensis]
MLDELYRKMVMDHYRNPRNKGKLPEGTVRLAYKNPTCGDVMVLYLDVGEDRIHDIRFEGEGCSISMASCSMMTELVKGKSLTEVQVLITQFTKMIKDGNPEDIDLLEDAASLSGVHALRARHNCALMGWQALQKALQIQ